MTADLAQRLLAELAYADQVAMRPSGNAAFITPGTRAVLREAADAIDSLTALDKTSAEVHNRNLLERETLLARLAAAEAEERKACDSYGRCRERLAAAERVVEALAPVIAGLRAGDEIGTALHEWPEERDREALRLALEPWTRSPVALTVAGETHRTTEGK